MSAMATTTSEGPAAQPRQTLAMRLAERERQRAERAERLARLRPGQEAARPSPAAAAADAEAALEEFLRALTGGGTVAAGAPVSPPEPAAVLHFQRPEAAPAEPGDLDRLPGAGPGLVAALHRAGLTRLAEVAPLAPAALAERLGPIGRLVPAAAWVAAARAAVPGPGAGPAGPEAR